MTFEFEPLSYSDKLMFVSEYADKLLEDYTEFIGILDSTNIKKKIIEADYQNSDNLRSIKRKIMNCFVELVGTDSVWNELTKDK